MDEDLLAGLDVVGGGDAGDDAEARVVERHQLRVGHERVVRLVRKGRSVVRLVPVMENENSCFNFFGNLCNFLHLCFL